MTDREPPEEPRMVSPEVRERYCTANKTHTEKRIITSDALGHVVQAHCASPTCIWCQRCFIFHTRGVNP